MALVSSHSYGEESTACLIIGVSNKLGKKINIVGSTINYGLHRDNFKVKVCLDLDCNIMVIYTPT